MNSLSPRSDRGGVIQFFDSDFSLFSMIFQHERHIRVTFSFFRFVAAFVEFHKLLVHGKIARLSLKHVFKKRGSLDILVRVLCDLLSAFRFRQPSCFQVSLLKREEGRNIESVFGDGTFQERSRFTRISAGDEESSQTNLSRDDVRLKRQRSTQLSLSLRLSRGSRVIVQQQKTYQVVGASVIGSFLQATFEYCLRLIHFEVIAKRVRVNV